VPSGREPRRAVRGRHFSSSSCSPPFCSSGGGGRTSSSYLTSFLFFSRFKIEKRPLGDPKKIETYNAPERKKGKNRSKRKAFLGYFSSASLDPVVTMRLFFVVVFPFFLFSIPKNNLKWKLCPLLF
jgi:hypothetical protein